MIGGKVNLDLRGIGFLRGSKMNVAVRKSINKAAAPVKAALQAAAPSKTGELRKSIRIKVKYYFASKTWAAIVGPSRKKKKPLPPRKSNRGRKRKPVKPYSPTRYAWQLEFGTKHSRPKPWLRPTLAATKGTYERILSQALKDAIADILNQN